MIPTLVGGDHIFTDKHVFSTREPRRGEVIVHAFPENPRQDFVKRVIGVAGDRLEVKGGHPSINGWEVPHCDVGAATYAEADDLAADSAAAVHRGEVFVEYLGQEAYLIFLDAASGAFGEQQGPYVVERRESHRPRRQPGTTATTRSSGGAVTGGGVPLSMGAGAPVRPLALRRRQPGEATWFPHHDTGVHMMTGLETGARRGASTRTLPHPGDGASIPGEDVVLAYAPARP